MPPNGRGSFHTLEDNTTASVVSLQDVTAVKRAPQNQMRVRAEDWQGGDLFFLLCVTRNGFLTLVFVNCTALAMRRPRVRLGTVGVEQYGRPHEGSAGTVGGVGLQQ
jgi:hypothetical protein